jgi:hypothetical protein
MNVIADRGNVFMKGSSGSRAADRSRARLGPRMLIA